MNQTPQPSSTPVASDVLSTHWSLIDAVAAGNREALNAFLERYLPAFRNYLVCTLRGEVDAVDDLLQQFLQEKFLEQNLAARVNREFGFRKFVYRSLKNFVRDHFRRERRRTDGQLSLDEEQHEHLAAEHADADTFDVAWADHVLRESLQRVRRECLAKNQQHIWDIFEARLLRPLRDGVPPIAYDELQRQHHFDSPVQAANALETAKRKLRLHLQEVVAEYAGKDASSVDSELAELRKTLSNATPRQPVVVTESSTGDKVVDESLLSSNDAPQRLANVLDLAQMNSPLWLPDEAAAILRDELTSPIGSACDDPKFTPAFREQSRVAATAPKTLSELFAMDQPPVWLLELVKRWSKSLLRSTEPAIPKEVAYVLHYACLCAGIRAGARSITRSSDDDILKSVRLLLSYPWIGLELRSLFDRTRSHLEP
ncbi:MAG TPA: hypothetical protein VK137_21235 [Planctomycetaceae bacterium]|nr:hypothetical protein [Planctomycetaceae bacterium]